MVNETDDRELVRESLGGAPETYSLLVERYQKSIYEAVLGVVHDPEDARDLTQTAFLTAFDRLESYDPRRSFFSWLHRIAINEALHLRAAESRLGPLPADDASASFDPHSEVRQSEVVRVVRAALSGIQIEYRAVLVLRHYLLCSYAQIAEMLNIPVVTVKSRLLTARQLLKDRLAMQEVAG